MTTTGVSTIQNPSESFWIEVDNAMGSYFGDVDDGFALYLSRFLNVEKYICTYGNTSQKNSLRNTKNLLKHFNRDHLIAPGARRPSDHLHPPGLSSEITYIGLAPLTTLASLHSANTQISPFKKIILVGGRPKHNGFCFPLWPHEFNFSKDGKSTLKVFGSPGRIGLVPLNQANRLRIYSSDWKKLTTGPFNLKKHSMLRMLRNILLKGQPQIILWDVVAIGSQIWPHLFSWEDREVFIKKNGQLRYKKFSSNDDQLNRNLEVLVDFDVEQLKSKVLKSMIQS